MKSFYYLLTATLLVSFLLPSCSTDSKGDWFNGEFHGTIQDGSRNSQVYFHTGEDGTVDVYFLQRGMDLNHYRAEWEGQQDTVRMTTRTRGGSMIEETTLVRSGDDGARIIKSGLWDEMTLAKQPAEMGVEDEEDGEREFMNILFLLDEIAGEPLEIGSDENPAFIYFEAGNQDFVLARAFLGCQLSSSSIAPREDKQYRIYPFPSVRDTDCPQASTEIKVRELYRTANNFQWEGNRFHIRSEEEVLLSLRPVGPVQRR